MASPSIRALGLSKRYGSFEALSKLDLSIEGGKCVGFLGPNGAGKTTTLKLFTDMLRPSEGRALINGISVRDDKRRALARCGVLIESPEIYPSLTANQALSMVAELRGAPSSERAGLIHQTLTEVKMHDFADKKIGKLSKGMKQRVNIGAALLCQPDVLLLDEPTTGLDPRGMTEVREIVKSLKRKDRLIFLSSHLLNEVEEICDEVAIIDHGKLLIYDTVENVTSRFSAKRKVTTIEVAVSKPLEGGQAPVEISALPNVVAVETTGPKGLRIRFSNGPGNRESLLRELGSMDIAMVSFADSSSALEDAYLDLIKEAS